MRGERYAHARVESDSPVDLLTGNWAFFPKTLVCRPHLGSHWSASDEICSRGTGTYTYTPVDIGDETDPAVTHIRISPKGIFDALAAGDPNFQVQFKIVVQ